MNRDKVIADVVKSYNRLDGFTFQDVWDLKRAAAKMYKFMGLLVVVQAVMAVALYIAVYTGLEMVTPESKPLVDGFLIAAPFAVVLCAFFVHQKRKMFYALNSISTDELNALANKYSKV